jgi:hypothetical protein
MPADPVQPYTSYLLRVWRVQEQDRSSCRALLESIATGERIGFDNLADLVAFLEVQMRAEDQSPDMRDIVIKEAVP